MEFYCGKLKFEVINDKVFLTEAGNCVKGIQRSFVEVQIAGENKVSHMGVKMINSSEGAKLRYVSHAEKGEALSITQESELVRVTTTFTNFENCGAVRIKTAVQNISDSPFVLEEVSAFVLHGISSIMSPDTVDFIRFTQSHHAECQPIKQSFSELGLFPDSPHRIDYRGYFDEM